jgi:hypothetical protein
MKNKGINRRNFFRISAVTGAGALFAPDSSAVPHNINVREKAASIPVRTLGKTAHFKTCVQTQCILIYLIFLANFLVKSHINVRNFNNFVMDKHAHIILSYEDSCKAAFKTQMV